MGQAHHRVMSDEAVTLSGTRDAKPSLRTPSDDEMPVVLGYELIRLLGRGGMGTVYEAHEPELDRRVALKVLMRTPKTASQPSAEARLAARIAHPGIVPVHGAGVTLDGRPFFTMDLIPGTSLDVLLADGPLPIARALAIGAQICGAVAAAHDAGVVHRDLKPANVMIDPSGNARILDFGLALQLDVPTLTHAGMGGTLAYMAPEHLSGQPPSRANDLYAIGVMLYEMLTGCLPFDADSQHDLVTIVLTQPPPPFSLLPAPPPEPLHPDLERICLRCLDKDPAQRFPNARALEHILVGVTSGATLADLTKDLDAKSSTSTTALVSKRDEAPEESREGALHFSWSFQLDVPPDRLWPFIAHTDRFNKAAGLASVQYEEPSPEGVPMRIARMRSLGMAFEWEELPFEWIRGREHRVYRRYRKGALSAMWNHVRLREKDGGTELVHEVWARPRGFFGKLAASWEIGRKLARKSERIYRRIERAARVGERSEQDAFEPSHRLRVEEQMHLDNGTSRLRRSGRFPEPLVTKLVRFLATTPDATVERIRPYVLADDWSEDRALVLDLLLHAVDAGLLRLGWDLVCPQCALPHETVASLRDVGRAGTCVSCRTSYDRDLASTVELRFSPDPALRSVDSSTYCIGAPALRPHTIAQQTIAPNETRELVVRLGPGAHRLVAGRPSRSFPITTSVSAFADECALRIDEHGVTATPPFLRIGEITITMTNATDRPQLMRVDEAGPRAKALTAAEALTHPSFATLLREELLPLGEHVSVAKLAFLVVDLADRPMLLDQHGDAGVFDLARNVARLLATHAEAQQGVLARVGLDAIVATFPRGAQALSTALALRRAADALPFSARLRIGVHEGRCLAFTEGDRVSYFGQTIDRAGALLGDTPAGAISVTTAVTDDPSAGAVLHGSGVPWEVAVTEAAPYSGRRITRLL